MLMLIISTIKEVPTGKSLSIIRSIYLIPGLICAAILASSGVNIKIISSSEIMKNLNDTSTWSDTLNNQIVLQNPVWTTVHLLIFMVLLIYVITQILIFFTKHDKNEI
jgi:hypothetical protein